jgi:tetratricopeptide (TPR) repeat protein
MAAARQEDLQALGQTLQERLQSGIPQGDALKIGCAISENGTLVVLSQHLAGVNFDPEKTFAALQQALESLQPQVAQPVKLYLRVAGQKQAYAKHDFILQPHSVKSNNLSSVPAVQQRETVPSNGTTSESWHPLSEASRSRPEIQETELLRSKETRLELGHPLREVPHEGLQTKLFSHPWRSPELTIPLPILVLGGGMALTTLFSSIYILTRPCTIGRCQSLQTAQQLSRAANHMAQWADSQSDLLVAQQQLEEANNSLKSIPRWSYRYQEAQQLSQTLSTQSVMLNRAIASFQRAAAAAQKGQNPPHTIQEWQAIQALWREAIAIFTAVPKNSALFPLAEQKLSEYQANLKSVTEQLQLEQQATTNLTLAKNTALLAQTRQDTAQSLQAWQKVKATWQTAVNILAAIPNTTTAYQEAQQLLKNYRLELVTASQRSSQEQMAAKAFSQAISFAKLAERDRQQNQFTKAENHWKQALNFAYQVPSDTQYHRQAQTLIASYSSSLQQAQAKLKVATVFLQQTRSDLNRTCSGEIRVCNYTVNSRLITVKLTREYEQALERSYISARLEGNSQAEARMVSQDLTLKRSLQTISDRAGIPLQVFKANGSPLHIHQPQ